MSVTYVVVFRVPADGVDALHRYEASVLPLLLEHDGTLERQLRSADRRTEVHIVSFPSEAQFQRYRGDPQREAKSHLLQESQADVELYVMTDVS